MRASAIAMAFTTLNAVQLMALVSTTAEVMSWSSGSSLVFGTVLTILLSCSLQAMCGLCG